MPVCHGWQLFHLSTSPNPQQALEAHAGFLSDMEAARRQLLLHLYSDSNSQIRAVGVNEGICHFLKVIPPCHSPVHQSQSEKKRDALWQVALSPAPSPPWGWAMQAKKIILQSIRSES